MALVYSPTIRGRRLALELRRLREGAQMEQAAAARLLGWSKSKLSRIEGAETKPSEADVRAIIQLFGLPAERGIALLQLRKDSWQRGWWTSYGGAFTGSFMALEDAAADILDWETQLVPGLLQTDAYAQAVFSLRHNEDPQTIHDRVTARGNRRRLLSRPNGPRYRAILDEGVLRRQVGGCDVMRGQLAYLREQAQQPNITIQVVPFAAGAHAGVEGSVVLFRFADDGDLDVAYAEGLGGDVYLESAEELNRIRLATESIAEAALTPEASDDLIAALAKE